jgi:hypothetical protein
MAGNQVWSSELWAPGPGVVLGQRLDTLHQRIYRSFQEAYCKGDGTETDMPGHINSSRRVMCIPGERPKPGAAFFFISIIFTHSLPFLTN